VKKTSLSKSKSAKSSRRKRKSRSSDIQSGYQNLEHRRLLAGVQGITELLPVGLSTERQEFGAQVDVSGNFAIIASDTSFRNNSGPTIVYQRDDSGTTDPTDDNWVEFAELDSSRRDFGQSIAIEGNLIAIASAGAVNTYSFDGTAWNFDQEITSPSGFSNAISGQFGETIKLSGSTLVVSEPGNSVNVSGNVFIYELGVGGWELSQTLVSPTTNADQSAFGFDIGLYEDTLAITERGNEGSNAHFYYRDATSQFQLEESLIGLSAGSVEAGVDDQIIVTGNNDGGPDVFQFYSRSDAGEWTRYQAISAPVIGDPIFDGNLLLTRPSNFRDRGETILYERDTDTGLWTERDVSFREGDVFAEDQFAAIDNGTILRGFQSDDGTAVHSGSVDFLYYDTTTTTLTVTASQVGPTPTIRTGSNEADGFGSNVAVGEGFTAVAAPSRFDTFDGGVSIFPTNDAGTPLDPSDDNIAATYTIARPDAEFGFGRSVEARGNQLLVSTSRSLLVYEIATALILPRGLAKTK